MRFRVRKSAHVLERLGLAMAGAASGLFVGVLVGSNVDALTSQGFLLLMMIGGAVGFYLGIDSPPLPFNPANGGVDEIDTAEFLSAVGTFLATGSAFASVGAIVLRHNPHIAWTSMIMAGWVIWREPHNVVPANAGTHNHRYQWSRESRRTASLKTDDAAYGSRRSPGRRR